MVGSTPASTKHQGYVYQLDFFDAYHDDHCYHQLLHHLNNAHVKLDIFNDIRATLERPQCSPLPQCLLSRPQRRRPLSRIEHDVRHHLVISSLAISDSGSSDVDLRAF
ncbi:hypothetical protein IW262DRAFT_1464378 [Armillaria fumosa]|nr:hypothetical protein IW262DRAFT_1464378 [Armillaria fumosa]